MSHPPPSARPGLETVLVGAIVKRDRIQDVLAALPAGDVLVAVQMPRAYLDAVTLAKLGAMGCLFTGAPPPDADPEG